MPQQDAHDLKDVDLLSHPAFVAWRAVRPSARPPRNIAVLQEKSRAGVYRLDGAGPDGCPVVAKRSKRVKNVVEWRIYRDILPNLPLPSVRCYGMFEPPGDETSSWLFLSVAQGEAFSTFDPRHRVLAGRWLALLHTRSAATAGRAELPDRSDGYYLGLLGAARSTMLENFDNPALDAGGRDVLTRCVAECDRVESHWDQVDRACGHAPFTLIHGDFAPKNMRVCAGEPDPGAAAELRLVPYDWGQAGFGVPAADLAQPPRPDDRYWVSPDLEAYRAGVRDDWPDLDLPHLRALGHVGRVFRALVCLNGDVKSLQTPWVERVVYKIEAYRRQMADAVDDLGWRGRRTRATPDAAVLEAGLGSMFRAEGVAGAVRLTGRERNAYASTFASEFVTCALPDGREVELFCKYGDPDIDTCYGHRGDAGYEADVYRHILGRLNVGTPRFYGSFEEEQTRRTCLAIERVRGRERLSEMAEPLAPLCRAAAWVGAFHAAARGRRDHPALIRHDESYYLGWVRRTRAFSARLRDRHPWVEAVCRRGEQLMAPLLADEPTVAHGEFYPHNLIVRDDGGIIAIDWQSAAVAAGVLDLAALTENWPADLSRAAEAAYARARWTDDGVPANFAQALQAARLHLHFRWLGDRPSWTLAQRSEWRFEQLRVAAEQAGLI